MAVYSDEPGLERPAWRPGKSATSSMKRGLLSLHPALFTGTQAIVLTLVATSSAALLSLGAAPLTRAFPFVHFFLRPLWNTPQGLLRAGLWLAFAGCIAFMLGKLRGFQGQAQTVLANIGEGVVILDRDWKVVYINEAGAPCATLSPRQMIGRSYWEVAPEASGSAFEQHIKRCARERVPVQFEMRTPRRQHWLQVRAYPLPNGVCCFAQDITEAKER